MEVNPQTEERERWRLEQSCRFGGSSRAGGGRDDDVEVLFGDHQDGEDQHREHQLMLRLFVLREPKNSLNAVF